MTILNRRRSTSSAIRVGRTMDDRTSNALAHIGVKASAARIRDCIERDLEVGE